MKIFLKLLRNFVLFILVISVIYPILWMFINGFKSTEEIFGSPWSLPTSWSIKYYEQAINSGLSHYFFNSIIVTVGSVVLVT